MPVLSIATWVTPFASSQSRSSRSSRVVVPNVRTSCSRCPFFFPGIPMQAATVFLCTSSPQQRSNTRSIAHPPRCARARRSILITTLLGVLEGHSAGFRRLPRRFNCGLAVPKGGDVSERSRPNIVGLFMRRGCVTRMKVCSEKPGRQARMVWLCCRLQSHPIALAFEGLHRAATGPFGVATVEVVRPQLLVGHLTREHVVDADQDRVRHRDDRLLVSTVPHDPPVARREGAVLGT